ncbi:MAG: hypothetical protein LBL46_00390 [Rickettsiales bacterium]|jgi:hypothetical protein|nr:hypothetical protein [Rickettsiales bacterium]
MARNYRIIETIGAVGRMVFLAIVFAAGWIVGARAMVAEDYSFYGDCGPDILKYCDDINYDLGECMIEYQDYLAPICGDAVIEFDRMRWGWDPEVRGRWDYMGNDARAKFRRDNVAQLRSGGGFHGGFRSGGRR